MTSMTGLMTWLTTTPATVIGFRGSSTFAWQVDWVNWFITLVSLFFLVLITVLMIVFVIKYRRTNGRKSEAVATHNTPLELTWSVVPLILVIVMFYLGLQAYIDMRGMPADTYRVYVTGQKWDWVFQHPETGVTEFNILRVPVDRPVRLIMESEDVIHSLYVPAFRVKKDVVPGRRHDMWFQATRTNTEEQGGFDLFCAEYCGRDHSGMIGRVYVYEEDEFDDVMGELQDPTLGIADDDLWWKAGPELYNLCIACHSLEPGVDTLGPSFWETHEKLLAGGTQRMRDGREIVVDEDYIARSLRNPGADVNEGFDHVMPAFDHFGPREVTAITEFIRNLDKFDLETVELLPEHRPEGYDDDA